MRLGERKGGKNNRGRYRRVAQGEKEGEYLKPSAVEGKTAAGPGEGGASSLG